MTDTSVSLPFWDPGEASEIWDFVSDAIKMSQPFSLFLEGSIAEGFGNITSDVDLVVVTAEDRLYERMPQLFFVKGRRIEIRFRTISSIYLDRDLIDSLQYIEPRHFPDEETLDRYQRMTRAVIIHDELAIKELLRSLDTKVFREALSRWFAASVSSSVLQSAVALMLHDWSQAHNWLLAALTENAKSRLVLHGETYLAKKWLPVQLERLRASSSSFEADTLISSFARAELTTPELTLEALQEIARISGSALAAPTDMFLTRKEGVTTWRIGDRDHLVIDKERVLTFGSDLARAWRALSFVDSLDLVISRLNVLSSEMDGCRALAILYRHGLIGLEVRTRSVCKTVPQRASGAVTGFHAPLVSIHGSRPPSDQALTELPIPAGRFAACGMQLAYCNMIIENAREDVLGAISSSQWGTVARSLRRIARNVCLANLSSLGIYPLPKEEAALSVAADMRIISDQDMAALSSIDRLAMPTDEEMASAALTEIDLIVTRVRSTTGTSLFPSSFVTESNWQATLDIGYDWARLGAFVDAHFPINQARELVVASSHL